MSLLYYRHALPVRIMHWINVVAFVVMLMSGLMIFNAHPTLYWGDQSYGGAPKLLQIRSVDTGDGTVGLTTIFGRTFDTTGMLGAASNGQGGVALHAFPYWSTIPSNYSLAEARRWHFFFMWVLIVNGVAYVLWSLASRHLSRDLAPTATDLRSIWQSVKDHVRFRHPRGEAAKHYNVLQKVTYLSVIFVWFPLVILMGFAMSPMLNAIAPGWVDVFGGRQSARTLHFVAAFALLAFMTLHVFLVITTGAWNNMRSMIDGLYRVRPELPPTPAPDLPPIDYAPAPVSPPVERPGIEAATIGSATTSESPNVAPDARTEPPHA
jgi:thiosulfate reductase cytochrome b subunit